MVTVVIVTLILVIYIAPRHGRSNILIYIAICSLIGSLSVLSVKGLGLAIKETLGGKQQLTNVLTWCWLAAVVVCISVQLVSLFHISHITLFPISVVIFFGFMMFINLTNFLKSKKILKISKLN